MFWWIVVRPDSPTFDILPWLTQGGAIAVLALAVLAFLKPWIYTASVVNQWLEDKDKSCAAQLADKDSQLNEWKGLARRGVHAAQAATQGLERVVNHPIRDASDQDLIGEARARNIIP